MKKIQYMLALLFVLLPTFGLGQEKPSWTSDKAWEFIPKYEYGNDCAPLLLVENEVEESTADPALAKKLAARLAAMLNDQATPAGRQFICLQLRLVGTKDQVPLLTKYLASPVDAENARLALESIRGEESLAALRNALKSTNGRVLIGVIGSLGKRKDAKALDALAALAAGDDVDVANAAINALGKCGIAGREALAKVKVNAKACKITLSNACRQAALEYVAQGKTDQAKAIYEKLTAKENRRGVRRAGFEGLLSLVAKDKRVETIETWYTDKDEVKATIAANHVAELSRKQLDALYKKIDSFGDKQKVAFLEYYVTLPGIDLFKDAITALNSDNPLMQRTGIVMLGRIRRPEAIEPLLALVVPDQSPAFQQQISDALSTLPDENVAGVLLKALENDAKRDFALKVLAQMKYYKAIDPIIIIAQRPDKAIHGPALIALGQLCDADEFDIPRMLKLYLNCKDPAQRELIARQITIICKKSDRYADPSEPITAALKKVAPNADDETMILTLPLLGRLGGEGTKALIDKALASQNAALQVVALRALCNWPDATYSDDLWKIASGKYPVDYRKMALRAYIRVSTIRSDWIKDRWTEKQLLEMLQAAMKQANDNADRQWCLTRLSSVRTMDAANWAASFLDDAKVSEAACQTIVDLAHHRFLREPNKARFTELLTKVEKTTKNAKVAENAKKARMGM